MMSCNLPDDRLNPFLHLLDGGLADNSGYRTAIEFLRQDQRNLEAEENAHSLYDDARAVQTSLNITRAEQQLLLRAGSAVVSQHHARLRQCLVQE